jgi:hypothetical protein
LTMSTNQPAQPGQQQHLEDRPFRLLRGWTWSERALVPVCRRQIRHAGQRIRVPNCPTKLTNILGEMVDIDIVIQDEVVAQTNLRPT